MQGGTLYVYLLGVRSEELTGPLSEFQATSFDRDEGGSSLVPLHYAIRALKTRVRAGESLAGSAEASELDRLLTNIERVINDFGLDPGRQVRDNIEEVRALVNRPAGAAMATAEGATRDETVPI